MEVEPIRLHNVDQMGLLVETIASVNRIERGPGPNELVFHRDEDIEIVSRVSTGGRGNLRRRRGSRLELARNGF